MFDKLRKLKFKDFDIKWCLVFLSHLLGDWLSEWEIENEWVSEWVSEWSCEQGLATCPSKSVILIGILRQVRIDELVRDKYVWGVKIYFKKSCYGFYYVSRLLEIFKVSDFISVLLIDQHSPDIKLY